MLGINLSYIQILAHTAQYKNCVFIRETNRLVAYRRLFWESRETEIYSERRM